MHEKEENYNFAHVIFAYVNLLQWTCSSLWYLYCIEHFSSCFLNSHLGYLANNLDPESWPVRIYMVCQIVNELYCMKSVMKMTNIHLLK